MADNGSDKRSTGEKAKSGIEAFGRSMQEQGQEMLRSSQEASARASDRSADPGLSERQMAKPESYRRGGKVRKGGLARVHKGEVVLTKGRAKKLRKKLRGKNGRV